MYHPTTSKDCRYVCNYTEHLQDLRLGDVAVFSTKFNVSTALELRLRGVLIGYESGESPHAMENLTIAELQSVAIYPLHGF